MKTSNNIVFGVVYPEMEKYLKDYADSINNQDTDDFDILIINDGLKVEIQKYFNKKIIIPEYDKNYSNAGLRKLGIDFAIKNNYEKIIFTDTDDFFEKNRFSTSLGALNEFDFVINTLISVDEHAVILQNQTWISFVYNKKMEIDYFLDSNIFGLSNSAVKVKSLKSIIIPENVSVLDWLIFLQLLLNNAKGKLIDSFTFYRQHDKNMVGSGILLTEDKLIQGIMVKSEIYNQMMNICKIKRLNHYAIFKKKYNDILTLKKVIKSNRTMKTFINIINNNIDDIYTGWWSEIMLLEDWRKYAE